MDFYRCFVYACRGLKVTEYYGVFDGLMLTITEFSSRESRDGA